MKNFILFFVMLILTSCNFNRVYKNRDSDKQDAEKVTQEFYILAKDNEREQYFKLFSDKFFQITNKQLLNQMIDRINKDCGSYIADIELIKWETLVSVGTNSKADYILLYKVQRNIKNTQEKIILQKEGDNIRIVAYDVKAIL